MAMINDAYSLTWGRLVKSWATGLDYLDTPPGQHPPPAGSTTTGKPWALPSMSPVNFPTTAGADATIPGVLHLGTAEFTAFLAAGGIPELDDAGSRVITYPPGTTDVVLVQGNATTMVLRLPPKSVLQASEQNLLNGGPYPTPRFYEPLFSPPGGPLVHANPPLMPDVAGIMSLHANRIGDYTMGLCA